MSNIELRFERPWLFLLLIPALLLILLPYFRMPKRRRKTVRRILPMVLHSVMAFLLILLLTGFSAVRSTDNQAVILLVDHSDSTLSVRTALDDRAVELQKFLKKTASVKTVIFGGDQAEKLDADLQIPDATNIATALDCAAAMLPDDKVCRIILLSDGRQTDGDGAAAAQYLHSQGVRIDTVWVDSSVTEREAQVSAFTGPLTAFTGNTVTLNAVIESNSKSTMTVTVHDGQQEVYARQFTVDDSGTVLAIEVPAGAPGLHSYVLTMKADQDTMTANNTAFTCVEVLEKPHVLLLSGNADTAELQNILKDSAEITVCPVEKPPRKITELCDYDGVILMNVHADDLPKNYGKLLSRYVSEFGRNVFAVGGTETFMYGDMRNSDFEAMMPVEFSLSRTTEDDAVALMLVMDCSVSMSQQSAYMSVAKQGAIKVVESMTENDYVGLISFNQTAQVEKPLEKNTREHKDTLNRIISGLFTAKGTYYTDALKLAHQELLKSDAEIRHILFVSDGAPADTEYTQLFPEINADGITVSTIALGHESTVLSEMANSCGGTYYFVQEATELPNIMLSLTRHVTVNSLMLGGFQPETTADSSMDLPVQLPALSGYLGTTLRRGADVHMTVEGNPLLASHTWGKGTVTVFTSDMTKNWCSRWLEQPALVKQIFSNVLPKERHDSALTVETTAGVRSVLLTVNTADTESYALNVKAGGYEGPLNPVAPGVYRATLPVSGVGGYAVTVTQTDIKGNVLDTWSATVPVSVNTEYDAFADNGEALLKSISLYGGGMNTVSVQALAEVTAEEISTVKDFHIPIGIIFTVLFVADTGIRKLRWKDLKNLWYSVIRK